MANKKKKKHDDDFESESSLQKETIQSVLAIVFFVFAIFLLLAFFEKAGIAGKTLAHILYPLLGIGYFILPLILILLGIAFLLSIKRNLATSQSISAAIFFLSSLGLLELIAPSKGGRIGSLIVKPTLVLFDTFLTGVIFFALLVIAFLIIFDSALRINLFMALFRNIKGLFYPDQTEELKDLVPDIKINGKELSADNQEKISNKKELVKKKDEEFAISPSRVSSGKPYAPPPLNLLSKDRGKPGVGDIKANVNIIKRTLQNFGIDVEMDEVTIGPTVTRYALKPAEGVKLSKIIGLQNDLSLALAAHPLRIEAPIPGKSLVGIEIPNSVKTVVGLGDLLSEEEFEKSPKSLLVSLGKAISGKPQFGDLAKMPHLLIAGTTGSGKSVMVHSIITSLLYRNSPENLKFILIDPKRVELTLYNNIPHLLTPVLTEPKKAIFALKWATKEMERRYNVLETEKVRDISSYHKNILEPKLKKSEDSQEEMPEAMPYIVVIIDELADIMTLYPRELEAVIVRLAQMSRAVGIHLILSTQRPSVNVITGLIKANIPTRIALQVASQVDSRTIIDMAGAEKLLGAGDMLFLSNELSKPQRIQSAFITESEVKNVSKYLIDNYDQMEAVIDLNLDTANNVIEAGGSLGNNDENDELYEEAKSLILKIGKASTSYLQRRLKIGYARAARLIDLLEEHGVVGPGEGAKPREVYGSYATEEEESALEEND